MNNTDDRMYFRAEGEAHSRLAAYFDRESAQVAAAKALAEEFGLSTKDMVSTAGDARGYWWRSPGEPLPEGWRRPNRNESAAMRRGRINPAVYAQPDAKTPEGKALWARIPPSLSWSAIESKLGLTQCFANIDGNMYVAGYGAVRIGKGSDAVYVVTTRGYNGEPFGGAPKGCTRIKTSEYHALREAAEEAL